MHLVSTTFFLNAGIDLRFNEIIVLGRQVEVGRVFHDLAYVVVPDACSMDDTVQAS